MGFLGAYSSITYARTIIPFQGDLWASPLVADGKVYLGPRRGDFGVFAAAQEQQILATIDLAEPVNSTATAANGVLYVATMSRLSAVARQ